MADVVQVGAADYVERYGAVDDEARVAVLLRDALALLLSEYERHYGSGYEPGAHAAFDRSVVAVCCAVVARVLSRPEGMDGVSQLSQTAGSYNASVSFANPSGDLYVTKGDYKRLGLLGGSFRSIDAMTHVDRTAHGAD